MNYIEFSQNIKKKYPEYNDIDDLELAKKIVTKYPEYNDITFDDVEEKTPEKNSIVKMLENTGSKIYDGINKITEPAIDVAKNINIVADSIKKTVSPIDTVKSIANGATVKEYNNIEPILRARTKEDDTAKIVYEPDSFDILANKIAVASAGGSVENIDDLKRLKDKQDFAVLTAQLPTLALTGAMPVTALAGFAGLQQLKNLIVTKAKGEKYSPMQIRMLTEMLPEDTNDYIKLGASLLEAVGDTAVIGAGVNKFKKTLLTDAVNNTIDKLKNAGYKITAEQEQLFKTAVNKRVESINPDDAVAINIKTKMAKIPKNKANMETDINKNNFIEVAGDIADRYKNHNNIKITKEQVNKDFNNLIKIENIVKNTKANIKLTGKELLPVENKNIDYDLNDVDVVRNLAKQYYKDNLQEGKYYLTRPEIDGKIYFTGRQKFFSANNKNIEALKMLPMVKEIIEKGKVLPFSNIVPGVLKKANKNVIGYYFITDVVEQNGINKLVTISLEKDKFGNYFYNLNNGVIDTLKKKLGKSFNPDLESGVHFPSADIIGQNNDGVNDNINYNDTVENITKQIANTEDDIARQMIEKDVPNSYGITDDVANVKENNYEDLGINIGGKGNNKKIQNEEINNNSIKSYSLATNKTNIKIKDNEKPNMSDFKLYQRTYDLAKKYMVGNIAESKYRPKNNLGVYYNYGSRKGNIYINSLLNVDVVAHELVHAIDDNLHIITELYNKGFKAETTVKGKKAITTFVPDISIPEGQVVDELLKATKDLYPVDISKKSVKSRLAEGLATLIQYSIVNPDMIENFYPNAYKWAMSNDTLKSFRNDARQIIVDYESLNPVKKLTSEIYDKAQEIKEKTKVPLGVRIDSQLFDSEAVYRMLDKDLYLTAKGYRTVLRGILENNLTNENGKMYIIDNHGNPVKVSDSVNWRTLIEDVQKAQSEFNGYLVARRFVAWYDKQDKIVNELMILGDNLKKIQQRYNEANGKIKNNDFYNMDDLKAGYENERKLKLEMDKLTRQIEQESEKLQKLQNILIKSGKNEQNIKDAYKVLNNTQNIELAKKYDFLMKCNLTVLRTAKLIDKDMYNELVDNFGYAPFNRIAYNELTGEDKEFVKQIGAKNDVVPKIVSSNWNIKNLKKIKGSDLPILSPLYSSIQLMKEAYKKSYKQIVANRIGEIAELYPELMQKVPYKAGDEKNNSVLVVVGTDKATGKEIKQTLEMDPFIKKVWENLVDNYKMSGWEKLMIVPAKFFTLMTTAENSIFAVTNFLRDQITASVNSDMGFKPFFTPIMVYVKSRQNPVVKQYFDEYNELFGESNTYLSNLDEVNPDDLAKAFKTNAWWKIFGFVRKSLSFLPNLSEMVTRRTEYVKARGAGFDIIAAKRLADEVSVPFVDRGFWGGKAGRAFLRSVPYMNAGLQVIRQGLRSILATKGNDLLKKPNGSGVYEYKEKNKFIKTLFAMVGLGVMQTAVSLWWDYIDDRTRKNLKRQLNPAQFLRFAYLPWGFNDTDLLRLPWEQLYSFPAVIGAMIYDEMKNDYDYKLSEYVEVLTGGVIPDNFNIVVPMVKSIFEGDNSGWEQLMYRDYPHIMNIGLMLCGGKKTYPTLQDIVPKYLQKREKAMQYDEKTSDLAKFLGWHFKIAPIKLDYYIYNVAGQVGSMFEKGGEFAIDKLTGKTQTGFVDFFTGNVTEKEKAFRKTVMPWLQESYFMYGREMQQFYEEKEKIEALEKSYKEGLRKLSSKELSYVSFNTPYIKTITNKIKQYNKFVKNATDSRNKLTFKQQKNNEQIKIKMENEIIDLVHKWKRAVKKAMKEVA